MNISFVLDVIVKASKLSLWREAGDGLGDVAFPSVWVLDSVR